MKVEATPLKDCFVLHNTVFRDERGYFFESFNRQTFRKITGLDVDFVQDNQSKSQYGVLRGLHFQTGGHAQAKLVRVLEGEVLDVAVDIRKESPTFGQHFSLLLSEHSDTQLFLPRGFAHGFVVLSETATFFYKCDNYYHKESEGGIAYNDPELAIDWKVEAGSVILSEKDRHNPTLKEYRNSL
ncbi:MAG TPA: dTDP-4-dehydrorhamnose 3,5-epimerase [Chitinophagaceae bacterium]